MKKLITVFMIISIALTSVYYFNISKKYVEDYFNKGEYEIINYETSVNVGEDNIYQVEDRIDVNFLEANTKFIYEIPLEYEGYESDIRNINVFNTNFTVSKDYINKNILVTVDGKDYTGTKNLIFKYTLDKGKDIDNTKDFFEHYFVSKRLSSEINALDFTVKFPNVIDESKIKFYKGDFAFSDDITYQFKDKTLIGKADGIGSLYPGFNVSIDLDEGYYKNVRDNKSTRDKIFKYFGILTVVFFIIWFIKGKDDKIVAPIQFHAPAGLDPLEIGYWIDRRMDYSDMYYMILYWANAGYITIEQLGKEYNSNGKPNFVFKKIKKLDINTPEYQKVAFEAFFDLGDGNMLNTLVLKNSSGDRFGALQYYGMTTGEVEELYGDHLNEMKENKEANDDSEEDNVTSKKGFIKHIDDLKLDAYDANSDLLFHVLKVVALGAMITAMYVFTNNNSVSILDKIPVIIMSVYAVVSIFVNIDDFIGYTIFSYPFAAMFLLYFTDTRFTILCSIMIFFTAIVRKRNFYYNELLGQIFGFKKMIVCKDKVGGIDLNVTKNPMYFYEILPYALILFKADAWVSHFKTIPSPIWYINENGEFLTKKNILNFIHGLEDFCNDLLMMVSISSSSNANKSDLQKLTDNK